MTGGSFVRWGGAAVVFVAIALASMRFGHTVGIALLAVALLAVFVLDLGAKRREADSRAAAPDDGPDDGPDPG